MGEGEFKVAVVHLDHSVCPNVIDDYRVCLFLQQAGGLSTCRRVQRDLEGSARLPLCLVVFSAFMAALTLIYEYKIDLHPAIRDILPCSRRFHSDKYEWGSSNASVTLWDLHLPDAIDTVFVLPIILSGLRGTRLDANGPRAHRRPRHPN
ncbi:hypothetical protein PIIN_10494 [Serendipita indica DSM 11827]|uniref:Uncharacterized protein n=1 Tax=Serendipita indica (strain DSM 11827) TaxID=1109443 RepID=G4TYV8_SERID|nr:hypothetical protein PIIN_10494 [Serendipita indica DSM 11827]